MNLSCHCFLFYWISFVLYNAYFMYLFNLLRCRIISHCALFKSIFSSSVVLKVLCSNSIDMTLDCPYSNSNGVNNVVVFHVVLYAHIASRSLIADSLWMATIFVRIASISLLLILSFPLAWEWYGDDLPCMMLYSFYTILNWTHFNLRPFSSSLVCLHFIITP